MNIVIIGPGNDEKRFGRQFVNISKQKKHTVYEFSYRLDSETPEQVTTRFKNFISEINTIDILLYNVMAGHYPGELEHFNEHNSVNFYDWTQTIICNVALPHMFSLESLHKMNTDSSIIFMTSTGSYLPPSDLSLSKYAGYFGSKAAQNYLMWALADHNNKKVTVCSIAPHFPYEDQKMTDKIILSVTDKILNTSAKDTGKIFSCFPPIGEVTLQELRR
ncbi:SDR family oxidoreductase [bacterium]|nr:SDR family oxidoreductase [bacterium]